jgi:hypothetical protein
MRSEYLLHSVREPRTGKMENTLFDQHFYAASLLQLSQQAEILQNLITMSNQQRSSSVRSTPSPTASFYDSSNDMVVKQELGAFNDTSLEESIDIITSTPTSSSSTPSFPVPLPRSACLPFKYHKNMARHFPNSKVRTPEEQQLRQKNTEAARLSRIKSKIMESMMDTDIKKNLQENFNSKRTIASQRIYANMLLEILGRETVDWSTKWNQRQSDVV